MCLLWYVTDLRLSSEMRRMTKFMITFGNNKKLLYWSIYLHNPCRKFWSTADCFLFLRDYGTTFSFLTKNGLISVDTTQPERETEGKGKQTENFSDTPTHRFAVRGRRMKVEQVCSPGSGNLYITRLQFRTFAVKGQGQLPHHIRLLLTWNLSGR